MATHAHNRPLQSVLNTDYAALLALKLLPDYAPANPALSIPAVTMQAEQLRTAQEAELHAVNALAAARNARDAAEWAFHRTMLNVKTAVIAQYGPDANAVQSLGLKRKSDYRRPTRRRSATTPA